VTLDHGRPRMKRLALMLSAVIGLFALAPASASVDDPSSPFYLLPTKSRGTTLHNERTH
jgi:hypothetical protein